MADQEHITAEEYVAILRQAMAVQGAIQEILRASTGTDRVGLNILSELAPEAPKVSEESQY